MSSADRRVMVVGASGAMLFGGLAALLVLLATPTDPGDWTRIDEHVPCEAGWVSWVLVGGLVLGLVGVGVIVAGLLRSKRDQTWAGSVVAVMGFTIVACGGAALFLGSQLSYAAACD